MYAKHIFIFVQYPDCPATDARLIAEDFSVEAEGFEFVCCSTDEVVYGDDESEVVRLDGRGRIGDRGESRSEGAVDRVYIGDVFDINAAFGEVFLCGKCRLRCRQNDARHLSACVLADGLYKIKATTKTCRHDAVWCEGIDDEDIVPFVTRGHDVREECIDDETTEGEYEISGEHQYEV